MSGPDLPYPVPGSNAIDQFVIGQSPIGTIPPFNPWRTVISQYANSPALMALILNFFAYVDQTANLDAFFDDMWNVLTAQGYGLDCWGKIVGINRVIQIVGGVTYFGFEEATDASGFNQQSFYDGQVSLTSYYSLSDQAYRQLILAKAFANITDGSIPSINSLLLFLFPNRGNCYVTESAPPVLYFGFEEATDANGFNQRPFYYGETTSLMVMTYTFEFMLTPVELGIVYSGVLPKPSGVLARVVQS